MNQIADVKIEAEPLSKISEGLIQAREIQTHIKAKIANGQLPKNGWLFWSPIVVGPVLVPVTRWIE